MTMPPWAIPRHPWYSGAKRETGEHPIRIVGTIEVRRATRWDWLDRMQSSYRRRTARRSSSHLQPLDEICRQAGRAHLALDLANRILVTNPRHALCGWIVQNETCVAD